MESELKVVSQQLETATKAENELKQIVSHREQELVTVKKENRKRRKMLQAAQSLMQAGANGYHKVELRTINNYYSLFPLLVFALLQGFHQWRLSAESHATSARGTDQFDADRWIDAAEERSTEARSRRSEVESLRIIITFFVDVNL